MISDEINNVIREESTEVTMANNDTTTPIPVPPNNQALILKLLTSLEAKLDNKIDNINNMVAEFNPQIKILNNKSHNTEMMYPSTTPTPEPEPPDPNLQDA